MPDEPKWTVRSPQGKSFGPFTVIELWTQLAEGNIEPEWLARRGAEAMIRVEDAIGNDMCDKIMRERREREDLAEQRRKEKAKEKLGTGLRELGSALDRAADSGSRLPSPFCCGCGCAVMAMLIVLLFLAVVLFAW